MHESQTMYGFIGSVLHPSPERLKKERKLHADIAGCRNQSHAFVQRLAVWRAGMQVLD